MANISRPSALAFAVFHPIIVAVRLDPSGAARRISVVFSWSGRGCRAGRLRFRGWLRGGSLAADSEGELRCSCSKAALVCVVNQVEAAKGTAAVHSSGVLPMLLCVNICRREKKATVLDR